MCIIFDPIIFETLKLLRAVLAAFLKVEAYHFC
jgi:hypothetical protein